MAKMKEVKFNVLNDKDEVIRQITVEVQSGKDLLKRAEDLALKQVNPDEREKLQLVKDPEQEKQTGKYKFTFAFEIYEKGVLKKTQDISAINDGEDAALDSVVEALKEELSDTESYRYTNNFKKQEVK